MRAYLWGTRGSLSASTTAKSIEARIFKAIKMARSHDLNTDVAILDFIHHELPFADRGGYGGNTACVEIMGQDEYVLCDAGTGLRDFGSNYMRSAAQGEKNLSRVFHIFMSHLHWDHIQGFPFFTPAYIPGHHIHIYGYHSDLERSFVRQQEAVSFPIPLRAMGAEISFHVLELEKTYEIAGLTVTGIKQSHPGDSYGYSFRRNGKKIVYSTDSEHDEDWEIEDYPFIPFFDKADLLIFDAQYGLLAAIDAKKNWGHSSNLLGVEIAVRAGVKHLCLFHSEHTSDDAALDQYLLDTRKYLNIHDNTSMMTVSLAYDGLVIDL
jgi:phosphoribosyl 1,2-cyclic phosphodiesterase